MKASCSPWRGTLGARKGKTLDDGSAAATTHNQQNGNSDSEASKATLRVSEGEVSQCRQREWMEALGKTERKEIRGYRGAHSTAVLTNCVPVSKIKGVA